MSIFSSLMWSGSAFYGDPFAPIIDTISDWGWSLLPQFPGSVGRSEGSSAVPQPQGPQPVGLPPVPVAQEDTWSGAEGSSTWLPSVLPRSPRSGVPDIPRKIVVVEGLPTEVERHPEGDFPAGSIFAPGQAWEPTYDARPEEQLEEDDLAFHSGLLDWGLDTLLGRQDWQTFGGRDPFVPNQFVAGDPGIPAGRAASPPSAAALYTGAKMTNGESCGNRRYVTLDRETGKISCKRRRRRRLLTNRDLADLASLKTITGGGAALNAAVIRAVR